MIYKPLTGDVLSEAWQSHNLWFIHPSHFTKLTWQTDISLCQEELLRALEQSMPGSVLPSSLPVPAQTQANGIPSGRAWMESNSKTYNWQFFHLSKALSILMLLHSALLWFSQSIASPPRLLLGYRDITTPEYIGGRKCFSSSLQMSFQFLLCFSSRPNWGQRIGLPGWSIQNKSQKPERPAPVGEWGWGRPCGREGFACNSGPMTQQMWTRSKTSKGGCVCACVRVCTRGCVHIRQVLKINQRLNHVHYSLFKVNRSEKGALELIRLWTAWGLPKMQIQ